MFTRKIILLLFLSISILPIVYAEANIEKININTADALTLENLQGIGPKKAAAIIEFRDENGMFESIDALQNVNGIGPKTVEKNRDLIEIALIPKEIEEIPEVNSGNHDDIPDKVSEEQEDSPEEEVEESPSEEETKQEV